MPVFEYVPPPAGPEALVLKVPGGDGTVREYEVPFLPGDEFISLSIIVQARQGYVPTDSDNERLGKLKGQDDVWALALGRPLLDRLLTDGVLARDILRIVATAVAWHTSLNDPEVAMAEWSGKAPSPARKKTRSGKAGAEETSTTLPVNGNGTSTPKDTNPESPPSPGETSGTASNPA